MVTDPVCKMDVDPARAAAKVEYVGQAYLNELVAVDGHLLHLFGNNDDEVIVMGGGQLTLL